MRESIDVNGATRTFTVVDREPAAERIRDLVMVFHGSKQTAEAHRRFTGGAFDALADDGSTVVAYLDGHRGNWNDARKESSFPARTENADDVAFTRAVIDRLVATRHVDPTRVFVLGYSNGGQMVFRLIHEIPSLLAGAAAFSATMPSPESFIDPLPDAEPVPLPVLLIHGTADPIAPFQGGAMRRWARTLFRVGGTTLSMPRTAEYFAGRNGITAPPRTTRVSSPTTGRRPWIARTEYRQADRAPVVLFTVHGGGHTVPGPKAAPFVLGRTSSDISAAVEVASFLGIGGAR